MSILLDLDARPVIAHRGASAAAPENTLAAFDLAARQGADAFELDVRLTADDVPLVIHDARLDRTTDRAGDVAYFTLAQIRAADAGARFTTDGGRTHPWRGRGIHVPTLAEVLAAFVAMPLLIEIKEARAQRAIQRVLREHRATERCVVASGDLRAVRRFGADPFPRGAASREIATCYWRSRFGLASIRAGYRLLSVPLRHRGLYVPTPRFVAAARRMGCPVHVWTVNDPAVAQRLWRDGVCGVVTDMPEAMVQARQAMEHTTPEPTS